jgi:hypothetical protein
MPINIIYYTIFFMSTQPLNPNQKTLGQTVGQVASNVFNRTLGRLFGAGLNKGAEKGLIGGTPNSARWTKRDGSTDWRVKLTIPSESSLHQMFFKGGNLTETGGIIFPITPSVIIQHQANYSQLATTHANYPYYAYQNSEPANLTIVGEFPVQNSEDAKYWVSTIHFLRAVTKMFFGGDDATRGNPPPILKLNGYGNHVFKNVPVIVTNFTCELRADVDYIATASVPSADQINEKEKYLFVANLVGADKSTIDYFKNDYFSTGSNPMGLSWAPSLSTITVQVQPVYSRDTVKNFSMKEFVAGRLNNKNGVGFI